MRMKIIEYMTIFEAWKAHRLIEKLTGKTINRDHKMGSVKFEIPEKYYEYIKDMVEFVDIDYDSEHNRNVSRIDFRDD